MNRIRQLINRWKTDSSFKTMVTAFGSLMATVIFAIYNGFLGIYHSSIWHGTICVYYIFLVLLRGLIIAAEKKDALHRKQGFTAKNVYMMASIYLLVLNISLVVPFSLMVRQQKPVYLTMVPAITMAAYTTYKVTMASIHFRKKEKTPGSFVRLLQTINFIDALVSIITLQNTLIMVNSKGEDTGLLPLTALSSGAVWIAILVLSVIAVRRGFKDSSFEQ